ncbi:protein SPO16 homolog [Brachionichthys hirsutus]|uniref:protein SPO16 homolog n=1 Tax=Brachionichthys hirsutus TaxID=412623 RepID=UPI003604DB8A
MATSEEETPPWKTTIIVSTSLRTHDVIRMLTAQAHRIRFSESVHSGAFIFPLSGTAFLLVHPGDLPESSGDSGLTDEIKAFVQVHRNSFLLLYAPFNGGEELKALSVVQRRFFGGNLRVLPVRNSNDIVNGMLTIAKATSKPLADSISDRMSKARTFIIEKSPAWETLSERL